MSAIHLHWTIFIRSDGQARAEIPDSGSPTHFFASKADATRWVNDQGGTFMLRWAII